MFKKLLGLSKSELVIEKEKDYRNVVITQIIIIVFGLTLTGFLLDGTSTPEAKFVTTIFSLFAAIYSFLLWDLLRNFTSNRLLINTFLVVLLGIVVVGSLVEFPYYKLIEVQNRQLFLLVLHSFLFPIEVTVISFAIRDIFSGEFLTSEKLWGAACIFLMTGICFGSLFHLICIITPGSLGDTKELGLGNYGICVNYSLCIMGGIDPVYPASSRLIKNISVLEAAWSNLFVVLIIGKLMGLPRPPKAENKQVATPN